MQRISSVLLTVALFVTLAGNSASATIINIINIDIEGYRTAGGGNDGVHPVTYVGTGALGGGNVFNGIDPTVVSDNSNSTTTGDMQTLSSVGGLLNSTGVLQSGTNFTIGPVGVDNENAAATPATAASSLFSDYAFNNTNGNNVNPNFTISGLAPGGKYDVFLYAGFEAVSHLANTTIAGGTATAFAPVGIFDATNTVLWEVNANGSGTITGTMGNGVQILAGLSIGQSVPEPASAVLIGVGIVGLLAVARRRRTA